MSDFKSDWNPAPPLLLYFQGLKAVAAVAVAAAATRWRRGHSAFVSPLGLRGAETMRTLIRERREKHPRVEPDELLQNCSE